MKNNVKKNLKIKKEIISREKKKRLLSMNKRKT